MEPTANTTTERATAVTAARAQMRREAEQRTAYALATERAVILLRDAIRAHREEQAACVLAAQTKPVSDRATRALRRASHLGEHVDTLLAALDVLLEPGH